MVRISRAMLRRILAHAAKEPGREVCGLLLSSPPASPSPSSTPRSVRAEHSRGIPSGEAKTALGCARSDPSTSLGTNGEEADERVGGVAETPNVAPDPATRFEIDPAALFAGLRAERAGGPRILGHYHSHPNGAPTPSARDAAMASQPGRLWLIVAAGEARMWRERPGGAMHGAFAPVELVVDETDDGCT